MGDTFIWLIVIAIVSIIAILGIYKLVNWWRLKTKLRKTASAILDLANQRYDMLSLDLQEIDEKIEEIETGEPEQLEREEIKDKLVEYLKLKEDRVSIMLSLDKLKNIR